MTKIANNIFQLASADRVAGHCGICDEATLLRYRDVSTGHLFGQCCCAHVANADAALKERNFPSPTESTPNN